MSASEQSELPLRALRAQEATGYSRPEPDIQTRRSVTEQTTFGDCPVCRQGVLVAMKHGATERLLLMCNDCESQWRSPLEAKSFEGTLAAELRGLVPASTVELDAAGWHLP